MSGPTNSILDETTRILRALAVQQGVAYSTYGDALQQFGERKIDWSTLFRISGDLYIKESATLVWSLIQAEIAFYAWMLTMAGTKPARQDAGTDEAVAPAGKAVKRGRR
jgi:hypothetical protein